MSKAKKSYSKYRAIKSTYNGVTFHSKKEKDYAVKLDMLKKSSIPSERVLDYKIQVKFPVLVNGFKICTYILDFMVQYCDGRVEHVDVKGYITPIYRIKKKLVEAIYGIVIIEK